MKAWEWLIVPQESWALCPTGTNLTLMSLRVWQYIQGITPRVGGLYVNLSSLSSPLESKSSKMKSTFQPEVPALVSKTWQTRSGNEFREETGCGIHKKDRRIGASSNQKHPKPVLWWLDSQHLSPWGERFFLRTWHACDKPLNISEKKTTYFKWVGLLLKFQYQFILYLDSSGKDEVFCVFRNQQIKFQSHIHSQWLKSCSH